MKRIDPQTERRIVKMISQGVTKKAVAESLGHCRQTVYNVQRRLEAEKQQSQQSEDAPQ